MEQDSSLNLHAAGQRHQLHCEIEGSTSIPALTSDSRRDGEHRLCSLDDKYETGVKLLLWEY